MNIFSAACYIYTNLKKKLDLKWEKRIFVEYDRKSLSYMVFYLKNKRVQVSANEIC